MRPRPQNRTVRTVQLIGCLALMNKSRLRPIGDQKPNVRNVQRNGHTLWRKCPLPQHSGLCWNTPKVAERPNVDFLHPIPAPNPFTAFGTGTGTIACAIAVCVTPARPLIADTSLARSFV